MRLSRFAVHYRTHVFTCDCGTEHQVEEYKEPASNESGVAKASCNVCEKTHQIRLSTNVAGCKGSDRLTILSYEYPL